MTNTQDSWPAGATYVFQGTVAETADAGTHVVTATITPGVGTEMLLEYGSIVVGNSAAGQVARVDVTDGTNVLFNLTGAPNLTTAFAQLNFPTVAIVPASGFNPAIVTHIPISGPMQLVLKVTTAVVSLTQSFAVVCRIKGAKPTVVLNDTIGAFVATTNTDRVF